MQYKLSQLVNYSNDKINSSLLTKLNYISTENMLPNIGGIIKSSNVPLNTNVCKFTKDNILLSNIRPYFHKLYLSTFTGGCSNDVLCFKITNPKIINPKYLYYAMSTKSFINYVVSTSKGTKMPRGDKNAILEYTLNVASIPQQLLIVDIIGSLDDKIENNNKIINKLWQKLQLIHTDFKSKNELVEKNILELADIKYGKGIPTSEILKDGLYSVYGSNGIIGYLNNYTFKEHKIAISCRGNSSGIIHLTDENSTVTSNSLVLDFKNFDYTYYFFLEFMYKGLYEYKTGSAQPQITIDNLKILNLQVPKNINDYIKNINDSVEYTFCLKKENQKLFLLKQFYLKKFFG